MTKTKYKKVPAVTLHRILWRNQQGFWVFRFFFERIGIWATYFFLLFFFRCCCFGNHLRDKVNRISALRCEHNRINYWKSKQISDWCSRKIDPRTTTTATTTKKTFAISHENPFYSFAKNGVAHFCVCIPIITVILILIFSAFSLKIVSHVLLFKNRIKLFSNENGTNFQ